MKVTTFQGVVENGQIKLPDGVRLPDKAKVYVVVPDFDAQSVAHISSPRLVHPEQIDDFKKQVVEESPDANV